MSISAKLAELMGGTIWFDSEEGKGSTFHFTAVLTAVSPPQSYFSYHVTLGSAHINQRVIVIDRNETAGRAIVNRLSSWNLQPICASSATEGLKLIKDHAYDNAIQLAIIDSREDSQLIHEIHSWIPVLIMLNKPSDSDDDEYKKSLPYIKKPVKDQQLCKFLCGFFHIQSRRNSKFDWLNNNNNDNPHSPKENETLCQLPATERIPLRILVAEDNFFNQKIIEKTLQTIGYSDITVVENGLEALEAVKTHQYDVVFMDCLVRTVDQVLCLN